MNHTPNNWNVTYAKKRFDENDDGKKYKVWDDCLSTGK